jgi:outer membrane receptor protein involved in Fe transport
MNRKLGLMLFFCMFINISFSFAQNISGFIYDANSEEPIIGATVYCESDNIGTATNNYGFFSLNIKSQDTTYLRVSYIGYKTKIIPLVKKKHTLKIYIEEEAFDLQEVVVTADRIKLLKSGTTSMTMEQIKQVPSLIGEPDVLKAFQLLPGVQSGTEGSVGLNVRGGSNDQNLYLLDGVPLYYINHIGGFSSVFDVSSIKSAVLYKGFFPASYGGRLSSVMDVVMKDGNVNEVKKEVSVGTLTSKFFIEGGLGNKKKTTYVASARICNIGLFTMLTDNGSYLYYDLNGKITHRINDKNKLYFSYYMGDDLYNKKDVEKHGDKESKYNNRTTFGNKMASMKWLHVFKSDVSSNLMLTYSNFHNNTKTSSDYYSDANRIFSEENINSSMRDIQLKGDLDYWHFSNHRIKFGIVSGFQLFKPQVLSVKLKEDDINRDSTLLYQTNALQNDIYVEDLWTINDVIKFYAGLRMSSFLQNHKKNYSSFEPRLSLNIYPFNNTSISIGYSKMSQYIHLLTNSDGGIPKDLWVPSTDKISPEHSNQYEIEIQYKILKDYNLSFNLYYKDLYNLIDYAYYIQANNYWEDNIEVNGKGTSKGIECILSKESGVINGFISYAFSKSTRQFEKINNGNEYPFKYDCPHQINLLLNYKINKILTFTTSWNYHTGNAITMSFEKYHLNANIIENSLKDIHIYNGRNANRMPDYHRLDIGLTVKQRKGTWNFGIYNVYNRQNPYFYYFTKVGNIYKMKQTSLFPILPSISYTYIF